MEPKRGCDYVDDARGVGSKALGDRRSVVLGAGGRLQTAGVRFFHFESSSEDLGVLECDAL